MQGLGRALSRTHTCNSYIQVQCNNIGIPNFIVILCIAFVFRGRRRRCGFSILSYIGSSDNNIMIFQSERRYIYSIHSYIMFIIIIIKHILLQLLYNIVPRARARSIIFCVLASSAPFPPEITTKTTPCNYYNRRRVQAYFI